MRKERVDSNSRSEYLCCMACSLAISAFSWQSRKLQLFHSFLNFSDNCYGTSLNWKIPTTFEHFLNSWPSKCPIKQNKQVLALWIPICSAVLRRRDPFVVDSSSDPRLNVFIISPSYIKNFKKFKSSADNCHNFV